MYRNLNQENGQKSDYNLRFTLANIQSNSPASGDSEMQL